MGVVPLFFLFQSAFLFFLNSVSLLFRDKRKHNITLQLIMATSGEGSNPHDRATSRPLAQLQELEPRVARRRLSQARHRATLAGLFSNLRETVYSRSELTASKVWGDLSVGRKSLPTWRDRGAHWGLAWSCHPHRPLRAGAWVGQRSPVDSSCVLLLSLCSLPGSRRLVHPSSWNQSLLP